MPLRLENEIVLLEGRCPPEEAEPLLDMLRTIPMPAVDLAACEDFHSALLQVLLAARPAIKAMPSNHFLAECLSGMQTTAEEPEISAETPSDSGDRNDLGA